MELLDGPLEIVLQPPTITVFTLHARQCCIWEARLNMRPRPGCIFLLQVSK